MHTFKSFLVEATSVETALKVMGLERGFSREQLVKKRAELAKLYHPDRGGDINKMAAVNDAYDVLVKIAGSGGSSSSSAPFDWDAHRAKDEAFAKIALDAVRAKFKPDAFTKHFEAIFKQPFSLITKASDDSASDRRNRYGNSANINCEWYNADRSTVLYMSVSADYTALFRGNTLAAHDADFQLSIYTEILSNRRKIKLAQRDFRLDQGYQALQNPEVMFPAKKLGTKSATEAKNRPLKKRDVQLIVEKELGGVVNDTWYTIPVGTNASVQLSRITMVGHASYSPVGLWFNGKKEHTLLKYTTIFEVARAWDLIVDTIKPLKSRTFRSAQEVADILNKLFDAANYKNISESAERSDIWVYRIGKRETKVSFGKQLTRQEAEREIAKMTHGVKPNLVKPVSWDYQTPDDLDRWINSHD